MRHMVIALALLLCVLGAPAHGREAAPPPAPPAASAEGQAPAESSLTPQQRYTRLPAPAFAEASRFTLRGAAAEYARVDYATFRKNTSVRELYRDGVIDAATFIIGEHRFENIVGGSVLIFDSRHKEPVVGDIAVGAPVADVVKAFGPPGFAWQERPLIGYKTENFYIAFLGAKTVERIYLSRRRAQPEHGDVLPALLEGADAYDFPFAAWNMRSTQLWRGSLTHYRADGLCVWSGEDDHPVFVYKDYEGLVPETDADGWTPVMDPDARQPGQTGGRLRVFLSDEDYPEYKIDLAIAEEEAIQKTLETEGRHSPGGRTAAIPFADCTYERSGHLFRRLDGSEPDNFVTFGHYPAPPIWLNERYAAVETMLGFGIYDLPARPSSEEDAVFYLEYHDAAGPFARDFDEKKGTLAIPTEGFTIRGKNGHKSEELELREDQQLLLHFSYDREGNLRVSHSVVKRWRQ